MKWRQDSFDSEALNGPVLKIWLPEAPDEAELRSLLDRERPDLACCFAAYARANIVALERLGFSLISVRQTYERQLDVADPAPVLPGVDLVLCSETEARPSREEVQALAAVIGPTSRYFKDERIPADRSLRLYETWLTNSLRGGYADDGVLAYVGGRFAGAITLKVGKSRGLIDLLGVLPHAQSKGLGNALLSRGAARLRALGATAMETVTEAENIPGCRLYQRNGFVLSETELVYHWHKAAV